MSGAFNFGPKPDWFTYNLYLCHFLSTWNARSYEFASVLFTAAAFPEGLTATSWIGITTSVSIILFASSLGRWVDHAPSRLHTLLTTVSINRIVVIAACICWSMIVKNGGQLSADLGPDSKADSDVSAEPRPLEFHNLRDLLFLAILALGIIERLSRVANLLSIERDWVPTLAVAGEDSKGPEQYNLTHLNAVMGRIDLICKLGSPIIMSSVMSATHSPRLGAVGLLVLNLITWPLEYWTAQTVFNNSERLQGSKTTAGFQDRPAGETAQDVDFNLDKLGSYDSRLGTIILRTLKRISDWIYTYGDSLHHYFSTEVWMPSLAMTCLHFSVLTFSATLTVFLVHSGFSLRLITIAEVFSAVFELSSTVVFPLGVRVLSSPSNTYIAVSGDSATGLDALSTDEPSGLDEDETENGKGLPSMESSNTGVSRLGLLALGFMLLCLILPVPTIWRLSKSASIADLTQVDQPSAWNHHPLIVVCIIIFIAASRLGRWTNVLCTQQLAQSCVRPEQRSMFAGTEASMSSTFGLGHWIATVIWSRHDQFHWIALSSLLVTAISVGLYGFWYMHRR